MIIFTGVLAAFNMVRETFPEFSIGIITVMVPWPGADPEEVEEGIIIKIEEAIDGIEGVKQYSSTASENFASVVVEVKESYDTQYVKERVRNAVEAISTFPVDAEKPVTESLVMRQPVINVGLTGENMSEKDLKEWAERVKDKLLTLPQMSQVEVLGARNYEISIEVSEERLAEYGLSFSQVTGAVRSSSLNLFGGVMRTQEEEIRLRTVGRKYTGEELAKVVVMASPEGDIITLDRIATIKDDFEEDSRVSYLNGKPTVTVAVLKTAEGDSIAIARAVKEFIRGQEELLPSQMEMTTWGDSSEIVRARINLLTRNGLIGICLVFIVLWLFLDLKLSFWAGMGMPISVAGALALLWGMGETLNMISLFGLIMVLGIVVDDAIVVGEAIFVARKNGAAPLKAAVDGVAEVGLPVLAAVLTSIVAFIPLAYIGGIMGKFIVILPKVVIACLLISLVECLLILPAHLNHLPEPNHTKKKNKGLFGFILSFHKFPNLGMEWFISHVYRPFITGVLKWRYVALATAIAVLFFAVGVMQSGMLKFTFLPDIDGNRATAIVEFPNGTPISITRQAVSQMEDAFHRLSDRIPTTSGDPMVENMYSLAGGTLDDNRPRYGNHLGAVQVEMLESAYRGVHSNDILVEWEKEIETIPGVIAMTFAGEEAGPPGADIEIWLQGHDMDALITASEELQEKLGTFSGVFQIQSDYRPGKNEVRFSQFRLLWRGGPATAAGQR
jgi:multidrug efflux pump subunit AcrB